MPLGGGATNLEVRVDGKVDGYERAISRAKASTVSYERELEKLNAQILATEKYMNDQVTKKLEARNAAVQKLGRGAGMIGLVAGAGLFAAVKSAADFDSAMSEVQAATHETSGNMDALREAAIQAGQQTKFSATEAAQGVTALAKAGVSTKDILGGGLTDSLNLAAAGSLDVGQAADIAATTMNQFGLAGSDVGHIADVLAAAAGKAQGEVTDMAESLKYVGPVAAQMGLSLDETTGVIAELASQGILGSQAGTALRGMLTALTSPSKQAADEMERLKINMYDARGQFIGMDGVAGQLQKSMSGLSAADRDEALGRIFGNQQITAARILYSGGAAAVQNWTNKVNDSGYAAETAKIKMDNLKGDLEQLSGALETALIGTGSGAQGPLRGIVQDLTGVVNAYNKLPQAAQGATSGLLGLTAVLGGGAWFTTKVISGVMDTRKALADLGDVGPRAAAGLKAVGTATAVVGGVLILDSAIDTLEKSMRDAMPTTQELAGRLIDLSNADVSNIGSGFKDLGDSLDFFAKNEPSSKWVSWIPDIRGVIPGVTTAGETFDQTRDALTALDAALASVAQNGSADQARQAFASLAASQNLSGDQQTYLLSQLPQYRDALAGATNETKLAGGAAQKTGDDVHHLGGAFHDAGGAALTFKGVLAQINGFLDQRDAWRNYNSSVEEWKKSMKATGATSRQTMTAMDGMTRNLLTVAQGMKAANRVPFLTSQIHMLEDMAQKSPAAAKALNPIIDHLYQAAAGAAHAKGEQAKLITQYHLTPRQVATLIQQINMGKGQSAIRDLLRQYGLTPNQIRTAIELLGTASAEAALANLTRARTVQIHTVMSGHVSTAGGRASGGHVDAGKVYRVGEQGEELAVFDSPGVILSNPRTRALASEVAAGGRTNGGSSRGGGGDVTVRLEGPVAIRGGLDLNTGQLVDATISFVRQELDDASAFNRTMAGRRS